MSWIAPAAHAAMRKMVRRLHSPRRGLSAMLSLLIACGLNLVWTTAAQAVERVGDIEITVQPSPSVEGGSGRNFGVNHGYVEYRIALKNTSPEAERIVTLTYPTADRGRRIDAGAVASRTVAVAANQEVIVSLLQPFSEDVHDALGVRVAGVSDEGVIPIRGMRGYRYENTTCPAVLVSRNVPRDFAEQTANKARKSPPSTSVHGSSRPGRPAPIVIHPPAPTAATEPFTMVRSEVPVSQWSANWLGYSCYDAIVLTEPDLAAMPAEVQTALRRYVECGGLVVIHGCKAPAFLVQNSSADNEGYFPVGFGRVRQSAVDDNSNWEATGAKLNNRAIYVYNPITRPERLYDMLVTEAKVPVRGLFLLVLLFVLAIGPANVLLLSTYKKRIWLWWNVPAFSLLTCVAVFGYALLSDGWTPHGKLATFTFLDERNHHAMTIGQLSYYCPLTPSRGMHFHADTEVTPLTGQGDWRRYSRRYRPIDDALRFVDWTTDQHLTSGWLTSRIPAYFQVRKNEDQRERLNIEKKADGSLVVVNALGARIQRMYLADAAGALFEGASIPAGESRTLSPVTDNVRAGASGQAPLRELFTSPDWLNAFRVLKDSRTPARIMTPGSYVAFLDESPFIETPIAGAREEDTAAIVYGICKEHADGR